MFSELTAAAQQLTDDTLILDGEAIAYSKELEEYLPFQLTASRRRQHGIEQAAQELPLVAFIFDILPQRPRPHRAAVRRTARARRPGGRRLHWSAPSAHH